MKKSAVYIQKHLAYINARLEVLNTFLDKFSPEENLRQIYLQNLIYHLTGVYPNLTFANKEVFTAMTELKNIQQNWDVLTDGDLLGYIYQELQPRAGKKSKGQYFTPNFIVNKIAEDCIVANKPVEEIQVLDPACGSGQFLIAAYKQLLKLYIFQGYKPTDAKQLIVEKNLTGFDLDKIALAIARYNLRQISGCSSQKLYHQDFLLKQEELFNTKSRHHLYDFIIGNPPWGSKVEKDEKNYYLNNYSSAKSGVNTFSLFTERAFDFVQPNGKISFLVPQALLNIKAHRNCRKLLLSNSIIENVTTWGEQFKGVFAPSISFLIKQTENKEQIEKNMIAVRSKDELENGTALIIPQNNWLHTIDNIFNINFSSKARNIINVIKDSESLYLRNKENARFYMGIVTGNNKKLLSHYQNEEFPDPIVTGRDISQFQINDNSKYFKFDKQNLQQVASQEYYQQNDKILYKFIGKRLTFAVDKEGHYSVNNVNGIIPLTDEIDTETIVSILNSDLIQYFYENNFFTLKVLQGNLEKIPLRKMSKPVNKELSKIAEILSYTENEEQAKIYKENMNDIIYHQYGLKDKEAYQINDSLIKQA